MRTQTRRGSVALLFVLVLLAGCVEPGANVPKEFAALRTAEYPVRTYESFSEINKIQPVPAKLDLGAGALLKMALFSDGTIRYETIPPANYSTLEKKVDHFFAHPGLQKSLALLSYARQLKEGHPFRINPFVPYFTHRAENSVLADQKTGPAALVADVLVPKSGFEGLLQWQDYAGQSYRFPVRVPKSWVPMSGLMLLFDHEIFSIADLMSNPEKNLLQDVIIHEFTHVWHLELLKAQERAKHTVEANKTQVGHDAMIVSNPSLAFSEGLAIAFEALYGTTSSQMMNMTPKEREEFFGSRSARLKKDLEFLVNRQIYIRKNSYAYNLYDFANCTLRLIKARDSASVGKQADMSDIVDRIMRGEKVDVAEITRTFDWKNFEDRFYGDAERVSTKTLRDNCHIDSPSRLESKEGFVASLLYKLITSGALVPEELLEQSARTPSRTVSSDAGMRAERLKRFRAFALADSTSEPGFAYLSPPTGRQPANNDERLRKIERNFLVGFRSLASGILQAQASTLQAFLSRLLSSDSLLEREQQIRVAFEVLRVSHGSLMEAETPEDRELQLSFKDISTTKERLPAIYDRLDALASARELERVIARLGQVPAVYVQFESKFGGTKRMNLNLGHHLDLIDMFGENNKAIQARAKSLDAGQYFHSDVEFLDFAKAIGKGVIAAKMLDDAAAGIKELEKVDPKKLLESARTSSLKN
ncbi:MAG: hypothetical protein A2X94_15310 [Bdellovibrionales bacterium GWB1_55_8]|nr:MAG: hypothetical protein A2X94_15310 [Bdellovibrionales bacterium GWB1_55_8]